MLLAELVLPVVALCVNTLRHTCTECVGSAVAMRQLDIYNHGSNVCVEAGRVHMFVLPLPGCRTACVKLSTEMGLTKHLASAIRCVSFNTSSKLNQNGSHRAFCKLARCCVGGYWSAQ